MNRSDTATDLRRAKMMFASAVVGCLLTVALSARPAPAQAAMGSDHRASDGDPVSEDIVVPISDIAPDIFKNLPKELGVALVFPSQEALDAFKQSDLSALNDRILATPMSYRSVPDSLSATTSDEPHIARFTDLLANISNDLADHTMSFATVCGNQLARGYLLGAGEVGVMLRVAMMMTKSGTNCPWFGSCNTHCSWMVCPQCVAGIDHDNHDYVEYTGECDRRHLLCWCYP